MHDSASYPISTPRIAVDAMGGDFAPEVVVKGALLAAQLHGIRILLVGDEEKIRTELEKNGGSPQSIETYHAPDTIEMGEEPFHLIRKKKHASLRVAFELVRENGAHAVVSAGNSGAVVYGALFILKRLKHIDRPGIATILPSISGMVMVIDAGANTICRPQNLVQFAIMGSAYCRHVLELSHPRVGVLSNGEEESKGTDLTRLASELLKKSSLNYVGYAEGRDVFNGNVDVVVCDGFVGNVLLKVSEGVAESIVTTLKEEIGKRALSKVGYLLAKKSFTSFKKRFDYTEYGGAPLLGVNKPVILGHGKSNAQAVMNAIRMANELVKKDITTKLTEELQHSEDLISLKKTHIFFNKIFGGSKDRHISEADE